MNSATCVKFIAKVFHAFNKQNTFSKDPTMTGKTFGTVIFSVNGLPNFQSNSLNLTNVLLIFTKLHNPVHQKVHGHAEDDLYISGRL